MTIGELIARLQWIAALHPRNIDITVTFGDAMQPVAGGIIGSHEGRATLNLTPIKLGKVGGF